MYEPKEASIEKSGSAQIHQEVAGEEKAPTTDDLPKENSLIRISLMKRKRNNEHLI